MVILETHRLILRPFQWSDLDMFTAYRSDPEVARFQSWNTPYTLEQAAAFVEEMKDAQPGIPGGWYQFAFERKAQAGLIGDCALHVLATDSRQGEIGFTLSRPYQGWGFATEAVMGLLDYAFRELGLHRITATCDADNDASARLLNRVGMRMEGHFLENVWFKGGWGSEYLYAVTTQPFSSGKIV